MHRAGCRYREKNEAAGKPRRVGAHASIRPPRSPVSNCLPSALDSVSTFPHRPCPWLFSALPCPCRVSVPSPQARRRRHPKKHTEEILLPDRMMHFPIHQSRREEIIRAQSSPCRHQCGFLGLALDRRSLLACLGKRGISFSSFLPSTCVRCVP